VIFALGDRRIETAGDDYYIAPGACVIGSVRFGKGSSVWFNCVLRGDADWIELGEGSNVQDGSVIHADEGEPTTLGRNVSVGHCALLHSCIVGDSTLICVIAAGALVPPDKAIPDGSVVMGVPGKIVRQVDADDLRMIAHAAAHYRARIALYKAELRIDDRPDRSRR
jgi:carbonic anhydrase/acetyltransferase-like protein (isoleucine patch superfamily)